MSFQRIKKTFPLRGISVSIEDVRRIVERLLSQVSEEGHREVARLLEIGPDTSDRREELEKERQHAFRVSVTIVGRDGQSLFGDGTEPFDSPNIPEPIETIYVSNGAAYEAVVGRSPTNSFTLHLDFSTAPLIDNENPVSNPTRNPSNFVVEGDRNDWVAPVQQAVMDVLDKRSNRRTFIHAASVYDIGLVFLGFPVAFYLCWRFSGLIEQFISPISEFLSAAVYVYVTFVGLHFYKFLFGYTRWAFPIVELTSADSWLVRHRRSWVAILIAVIGGTIVDVMW